ncbi:hypothetical protein IFM89_009458 [Coptis chinensis]|uniref:Uncharacterized protein n=1 Tax=Coptis chinensis TaxID=261450 RepID=A0A835IC42_9MAGN|nr:hypothetical protein IFM89_009458 [Coptis chinensis]
MVNGKENGGEMKAKVGGNMQWTMTSFTGETLQRRWIERTTLPTNKIARSTTSDELTSMFRLKNFGIEQLSEYDKGHPVKEGELVVTFAQLEYGLMIPLDKEVSRVLSVWRIPPIQVSMSLWLVFARARTLAEVYRCPFGADELLLLVRPQRYTEEDGSLMFHVEWAYPEMKFKGLPGVRNWDKILFLSDRPSTTDFDVSSQALEHLRFYFSMDRGENI